MRTAHATLLRVLLIVMLAALGIQYELGIQFIMSDPQAVAPFTFSPPAVLRALQGVGAEAVLHAAWGGLLLLLAFVILVVSLLSRLRAAQVFGALGFLSVVSAAAGGLMFVLSGFQNDSNSHNMATNLLLSFTLYFVELYSLKGK
jgi:hypothetical protein